MQRTSPVVGWITIGPEFMTPGEACDYCMMSVFSKIDTRYRVIEWVPHVYAGPVIGAPDEEDEE